MRKLFLLALPCLIATTSNAQFSGYFAPHNWSITTTGASATASVDTLAAPDSLYFYGPNDDSGLEGNLTYSIVMPASGTLSFGFDVTSNDTAIESDAYEYFIWTHNADTLSITTDTTSGITSFSVDSGAVFTFAINSSTNTGGNINAKIFDWIFTAIALPVTGSPVTAAAQNGKVELYWNTYSETNNQGFEIQRSADGRNFANIGFVSTKTEDGNSSEKINYTFSDNSGVTGNVYYRYRQVDIDGQYAYSNIASVTASGEGANGIVQLFPNPVVDIATINVENGLLNSTAKLYNINGVLLQKIQLINAATIIDMSLLPAGSYIIQLENNTSVKLTKS